MEELEDWHLCHWRQAKLILTTQCRLPPVIANYTLAPHFDLLFRHCAHVQLMAFIMSRYVSELFPANLCFPVYRTIYLCVLNCTSRIACSCRPLANSSATRPKTNSVVSKVLFCHFIYVKLVTFFWGDKLKIQVNFG